MIFGMFSIDVAEDWRVETGASVGCVAVDRVQPMNLTAVTAIFDGLTGGSEARD